MRHTRYINKNIETCIPKYNNFFAEIASINNGTQVCAYDLRGTSPRRTGTDSAINQQSLAGYIPAFLGG